MTRPQYSGTRQLRAGPYSFVISASNVDYHLPGLRSLRKSGLARQDRHGDTDIAATAGTLYGVSGRWLERPGWSLLRFLENWERRYSTFEFTEFIDNSIQSFFNRKKKSNDFDHYSGPGYLSSGNGFQNLCLLLEDRCFGCSREIQDFLERHLIHSLKRLVSDPLIPLSAFWELLTAFHKLHRYPYKAYRAFESYVQAYPHLHDQVLALNPWLSRTDVSSNTPIRESLAALLRKLTDSIPHHSFPGPFNSHRPPIQHSISHQGPLGRHGGFEGRGLLYGSDPYRRPHTPLGQMVHRDPGAIIRCPPLPRPGHRPSGGFGHSSGYISGVAMDPAEMAYLAIREPHRILVRDQDDGFGRWQGRLGDGMRALPLRGDTGDGFFAGDAGGRFRLDGCTGRPDCPGCIGPAGRGRSLDRVPRGQGLSGFTKCFLDPMDALDLDGEFDDSSDWEDIFEERERGRGRQRGGRRIRRDFDDSLSEDDYFDFD